MSQTMEDVKKVVENHASTTSTTTRSKKRVHMTEVEPSLKTNNHLILTTIYALNKSSTKNAIVGLELQTDGSFKPIVKIVSNKLQGISFGTSTWAKLQDQFEIISDYFETEGYFSAEKEPLVVEEYKVKFTSSFGENTILFDKIPEVDCEISDNSEASCKNKKQKVFVPAIAMQKASFFGLKSVLLCINEYLNMLKALCNLSEECVSHIIRLLTDHCVSVKIPEPSEYFILNLINNEKCDEFKNIIHTYLSSEFNNYYINIVYHEIGGVLLTYITYNVQKNVLKRITFN